MSAIDSPSMLMTPRAIPRSRSVAISLPPLKRSISEKIRKTVDKQFLMAVDVPIPEPHQHKKILPRYLLAKSPVSEGQPDFCTFKSSVLQPHAKSIMSRVGRPSIKALRIGPGEYNVHSPVKKLTPRLYQFERFKDQSFRNEEILRQRQLGHRVDENVGPGDYSYDFHVDSSKTRMPKFSFRKEDRFKAAKKESYGDSGYQAQGIEHFFKSEQDIQISPSPRFDYQTALSPKSKLEPDVK